jgi:hypothetical protein
VAGNGKARIAKSTVYINGVTEAPWSGNGRLPFSSSLLQPVYCVSSLQSTAVITRDSGQEYSPFLKLRLGGPVISIYGKSGEPF